MTISKRPDRPVSAAKKRRAARQRAQSRKASQSTPAVSPSNHSQTASSQWKLPPTRQDHFFFDRLPPELQARVLSHLPPKDIVAARRTCQELSGIISSNEGIIAGPTIAYHLNRLQTLINSINAARIPTDADTFLDSLRLWSSIRGNFRNHAHEQESYYKWFSHLAGGAKKPDRLSSVSGRPAWWELAEAALAATTLQQCVAKAASLHMAVEKYMDMGPWWMHRCSGFPAETNNREMREVYRRICEAQGGPSYFSGPQYKVRNERQAFPGDRPGRYRLTSLRHSVPEAEIPVKSLNPSRGVGSMLEPLGLPTLPPHDTFCYYATSELVYKKLSQVHYSKAKVMSPLTRAAVLERVKLF